MFELTGLTVLAILAGAMVGLVVRYFLFRLGCIMADLPDPSTGLSIVAVLLSVCLTIPLIGLAGYFLVRVESAMTRHAGLIFYPGMAANLVVCWLIAAVVYLFLLRISYAKGLIVSGVELLLSALLAALVTAVILVFGAGWQISRRTAPQSELAPRVQPYTQGWGARERGERS